ncbi:MAG: HAMP domain-containing sensor histidine kinase [Pseudomonadota bacterium]
MSLVSRVVMVGVAGLLVLVFLLAKGVSWSVESIARDNADAYLAAYADVLVPAILVDNGSAQVVANGKIIELIPRHWQISQGGLPVQFSSRLDGPVPVRPSNSDTLRFVHTLADGRIIELIQRDYIFPDEVSVTVTFGMDAALLTNYISEQRGALRDRLTPYFVLFALIAALLLAVQACLVVWPLNRLRRDIAELDCGVVSRLGSRYPSELGQLTQELNTQLDRREMTLSRYRQFASNLAHAIKTPLTALRLNTQAAESQALLDDVDALVERNLARVRISGSSGTSSLSEDALELLRKLTRTYRKLTDVDIQLTATPELAFEGDAQDFVEAVGNVLENACHHARARVYVFASPKRLEIHDDGPGIAASEFDRVLGRGTRLDEVSKGTGIGLPIAREIVETYGGSLELQQSNHGGLQVNLQLPVLR